MPTSARFKFKFTLLHGMILVAGLAACLSMRWMRVKYYIHVTSAIQEWGSSQSILLLSTRVQRMILDTPPYVAIGTLTLLLIYFCPPRPGLRRLTRRPGFVACFAASLVILVSFSMDVLELLTHGNIASLYAHIGPHPVVQLEHSIEKAQQYPGYAVGAAWGLLWFGGRWRSEPSRLDALGRALGYYWLGFIVLGRFLSYFY